MKTHYQSFFGRKDAFIISTDYEKGNFFINFIQDKGNRNWESYQEGLILKLEPKEICDVANILENNRGNTSVIHKFKDQQKDIWFGFEKKGNDLVFSIKGRSKILKSGDQIRLHIKSFFGGELRLFKKLWYHLEEEFVQFTTKPTDDGKKTSMFSD